MDKKELYLRFSGMHSNELEDMLYRYRDNLAHMVFVDDMGSVVDGIEVIEAILKERTNGAQ